MLQRIHLGLFSMHRAALRKPKLVLMALGFLVLVFVPYINQLQFLLAIDDLIDPNFQTYSGLKRLKDNFHDSQNIFLSIEAKPPRAFTSEILCPIQKWALDLNDQRNDLLRIRSTFGLRQAEVEKNLLQFKTLIDVDCGTADLQTEKIAEGLRKIAASPWGSLLTSNTQALTLSLAFAPSRTEQRYGQFRTESVEEIQDSFKKTLSPILSQLSLHWGGVAVYQAELRKAFDRTQALNGLMLLISVLIFRIFLRSWKAGFLFVGTLLGTLSITYGVMGASKIPIDVLTNATGLMMMISCLQDFVFVTYGTTFLGYSWRKSMRKFLIPSFYTSLTTVIGFGSLMISDLSIIRRFGAISAFAATLEWVYVFIFLPAILTLLKKPLWPTPKIRNPAPFFQKVDKIQWSRRGALLLLLILPLGLWGSRHLQIQDSPEMFFAKDHLVNQESLYLLKTRDWKAEVSLLFNTDLESSKKSQILREVSSWPELKVVESKEATENFLLEKIPMPNDRQAISNLWSTSPFAERLVSHGIERAVLYLKTTDRADLEKIMAKTKAICPDHECELASGLISYVEFGDRVLKTLFESLFVSLILVLLVLFTLGRKLKTQPLLPVLISAIWGPLALLGLFYIFQIPVFFVSTICASVLVGLAGDNTIQFLFAARQKNISTGLKNLGFATFIVSLGMMLLTGVFFLSPIWPLQKLGSLMILGFALAWIGDVLILKGLIKK